MEPNQEDAIRRRARETFDLFQMSLDLMRQNLRRRYPGARKAEIDRRLSEWLLARPSDRHTREEGFRPRPRP